MIGITRCSQDAGGYWKRPSAQTAVVETLPHAVRDIENVWIPMRRLPARLWLPDGTESKPVPAIVECIPYRKQGATAIRDTERHGYFAGHDYACLRIDMRGADDSDGLLMDEHLARERNDAVEAFRRIAA